MRTYPSYSVAIRTLGTAGDKYAAEIRSIYRQTVRPEGVYVYIPYGYEISPIFDEIYVRCDKGMVHQRSLPFEEIKSEFILFLDDDVLLPDNAIETLFDALSRYNADCIAPVLYDNHLMSAFEKFSSALFAGTFPSLTSSWAFKVRMDSHFSYCNSPLEVMPTQTASFACYLCSRYVYDNIHYEDERWLDSKGFAFGDDQLFFYKMYKYGYSLLAHYQTGIQHLDAKTSRTMDKRQFDYNIRFIRFVIWYRTIYEVEIKNRHRFRSVIAFFFDFLRSLLSAIIYVCIGRFYAFPNVFKSIVDGIKYVHSSSYRSIPAFMCHKKS